jgi:hypothetical protein
MNPVSTINASVNLLDSEFVDPIPSRSLYRASAYGINLDVKVGTSKAPADLPVRFKIFSTAGEVADIAGTDTDADGKSRIEIAQGVINFDGIYTAVFVVNGSKCAEFPLEIKAIGTPVPPEGTIMDWSVITAYQNTATHGPYRAGSNVTFSAPNPDGSVTINADEQPAPVTSVDGKTGAVDLSGDYLGINAAAADVNPAGTQIAGALAKKQADLALNGTIWDGVSALASNTYRVYIATNNYAVSPAPFVFPAADVTDLRIANISNNTLTFQAHDEPLNALVIRPGETVRFRHVFESVDNEYNIFIEETDVADPAIGALLQDLLDGKQPLNSDLTAYADAADAAARRALIGFDPAVHAIVASQNNYYRAALPSRSAANELTVADTFVLINGAFYTVPETVIDLDATASWDDVSVTDWSDPAERAGTDFHLYAIAGADAVATLLLSPQDDGPTGATAGTWTRIGGFHCLCVAVGTISGHPLTGMLAGDILPASIWDLRHRSVGDQEGTVYDPLSRIWVDIYLASWDGTRLRSVFGGTIWRGTSDPAFHWYNFMEEFQKLGKRLPRQNEFMAFSDGSNQQTNITGSTLRAAGGWTDTAGRRMISNIGAEECCGHLWQFGIECAGQGRANTFVAENTIGTANTRDDIEGRARGGSLGAPNRPHFGGRWSVGADCGSRCARWSGSPLVLDPGTGARGVAEPANSQEGI